MDDFFFPAAGLVRAHRPSQLLMAQAVADTLRDGGILIVEAPTGTGKSWSAGIPAFLSDKQVVFTTGKKSLQHQYFEKDLPYLQERIAPTRTIAYMKGKANYLCRERLEELMTKVEDADDPQLRYVQSQVSQGNVDLETMDIDFRGKVQITECVRRMCRWYEECGYTATRNKFVEANIRVANHAMVAMEALIGKGMILGDYDALVIDEAHVFISAVRGAFSFEYDSYVPDRLQKVHGDVFNLAFNREIHSASRDLFVELASLPEGEINPNAPTVKRPLAAVSDLLGGMLEDLWPFVSQYFKPADMSFSMDGPKPVDAEDLSSTIRAVFAYKEIDKARTAIERIRGRNPFVKKIEKLVADGMMTPEEGEAMMKEKKESELEYVPHIVRDRDGAFLKLEPVEVGRVIRAFLKTVPAVIITSATLRSGDSFDYMLRQFGLKREEVRDTLALPPTFDYPRQAMLYVDNRLAAYPKFSEGVAGKKAYFTGMAARIRELCEASQGGAFILVPSWEDLNQLRAIFQQEPMEGCTLIPQGRGDNANRLIDVFKQNPRNVLLATKSFWEGVDVPGMGLRLVIVTRMPFISESDAVYTRQKTALASVFVSKGMSDKDATYQAFNALSVNQACIELAQALGRLIRTETDRGGLAILDSRLGFSGRASYKVTVYKTFPMKPIGDLALFKQYLTILGAKAIKTVEKEPDVSRPVP